MVYEFGIGPVLQLAALVQRSELGLGTCFGLHGLVLLWIGDGQLARVVCVGGSHGALGQVFLPWSVMWMLRAMRSGALSMGRGGTVRLARGPKRAAILSLALARTAKRFIWMSL